MAILNTVPQLVKNRVKNNPHSVALRWRPSHHEKFKTMNYSDFWQNVKATAAFFLELGIKRGDHVALISDNRMQWLFCDLALMGLGAVDVPRGSDCNTEELCYIISHSDSCMLILENEAQLLKWLEGSPETKSIKAIILLDFKKENQIETKGIPLYSFNDLLEKGKTDLERQKQFEIEVDKGNREDIATLIYTSGTTGKPKGVMLLQESFVFQLERIYDPIPVKEGETMLSVLPIWHTFERIVEYILLNVGASIAYSKPVGAILLRDLNEINPQWLSSVPRIWESIYEQIYRKIKKSSLPKRALFQFFTKVSTAWSKMELLFNDKNPALNPYNPIFNKILASFGYFIFYPGKLLGNIFVFNRLKKLLGNNFRAGVSGGGALPPHIDFFFKAADIKILEGYGITETGPIIGVRHYHKPVMRTIGSPLPDIEYKILDPSGVPVKKGTKGKLYVKSPQVMKGYYKDPQKTAEVLNAGWFDTGDLVIETYNNRSLKIVGRAKETIVLIGGENIEPSILEERLKSSSIISNCMVVGQDQRYLGLLVTANEENLKEALSAEGATFNDSNLLINRATLDLVDREIQEIINAKNGFKSYEKIARFYLCPKEFEVGEELTKTLKLRRSVIYKIYEKEIAKLF